MFLQARANLTAVQDRWVQSKLETPGSVSTLDAVGGFASGVLDVAGGLLRRALYMFLVHVDFSG
jgi:hypothetical protein